MRTNFNIKTRGSKKSVTTKWVIVVVMLVLVITTLQVFEINLFGKLTHNVARSILVVERTLKSEADQYFALLLSKQRLADRNRELTDRLKELEPLSFLVEVLTEENNELKSFLNRDLSNNTVLGAVLAKPPVSLYDTLIVDVGESSGIKKGDLVLVYSNFVIGTIAQAYENTSLVTLFSSGGVETDVTLGEEHLLVEAIGRGGGNFVTQLPRGVEVLVGDVVILPNISTQIFGVVERVVATPADQFQTILFKNPINMAEITWVEIRRSGI